jgi:hypothetical protein
MGNSFCKQCNCNGINKDEIDNLSKYNIKYNSENNLYYTEINYNDEEIFKYRTSPGPPIIIRDKEAYINVLRII